jgi:ionotropic glutamate receptor NMDA 2B
MSILFQVSAEREAVAEFTVPFLESGIALIVAKRTGIISPTAFLDNFDTTSWMMVSMVGIQGRKRHVTRFHFFCQAGSACQTARKFFFDW